MTKSATRLHFAGTVLATLLLAAAAAAPSSAQSSDPLARTAKSKQTGSTGKSTKPAPLQVSRTAGEKPWTLENALPDRSASLRQYDYVPPQPKLGRVPLQSGPGTIGVETETKSNAYKTPDGRTIPGLEATESRSNSYVGFSLSVPTSDNSFPVPLVPPWGRP